MMFKTMIYNKNENIKAYLKFHGLQNIIIGPDEKYLLQNLILSISQDNNVRLSPYNNNEWEIGDEGVNLIPILHETLYKYIQNYKNNGMLKNAVKRHFLNIFAIIIECTTIKLIKESQNELIDTTTIAYPIRAQISCHA